MVEVQGRADHAGAVPMDLRRDPMPATAEIIAGVLRAATDMGRPAVTTVGRIFVEPNLPAAVPERVSFTIDARHPDASERERLYARHTSLISEIQSETGLDIGYRVVLDQPPRPCDPSLVRLLEDTAGELGIPATLLHSGAGHDSQIMSRIARVAMIFVRSEGGRSHTPEEFTTVDVAVAGIRVMAASLHKLAY